MAKLRYSDFADRIDIDAFEEAIEFEPLERSDKGEDRGYCFDLWGHHNNGDTTGKFSINRDKRVYHCWVCGGGSLLSLTMELRKLTEQEAIDWLVQFTTPADQSAEDFRDEITRLLSEEEEKKAALPYFNPNVLDRLETEHPWIVQRGISAEIAAWYNLRYDPVARRYSSKGIYEGEGIILPHFWKDRLVGWQTRWLDIERPKWVPKYTMTNDFPRGISLYNYEATYLSPNPIVVCESVPTVLFLASLKIPAIATFGSNVTPEQLRLLRGCQQGLILAPDNDPAGINFGHTLTEYLERYVPLKRIIPVPGDGADLGDLVSEPDLVRALYVDAEPV